MDTFERCWITPGEFGGTKVLYDEADADAWRKAGYGVTGPWVLEVQQPRGGVDAERLLDLLSEAYGHLIHQARGKALLTLEQAIREAGGDPASPARGAVDPERWAIRVALANLDARHEAGDPEGAIENAALVLREALANHQRGAVAPERGAIERAYRLLSNVNWTAHMEASNRRWAHEALDVLRSALSSSLSDGETVEVVPAPTRGTVDP